MNVIGIFACLVFVHGLDTAPKPPLEERTRLFDRQHRARAKFERCEPAPTSSCRLYPYGSCPLVGDRLMKASDDGAEVINLPKLMTFKFFSKSVCKIWVSTNGALTFDGEMSTYTARTFPKPWSPNEIVAPFWTDIDTRKGGEIYYRLSTSGADIERAQQDIGYALPQMKFTAKIVVVITWYKVRYYGSRSDKRNTFQCVLISDGPNTFAFYKYEQLTWTTGTSSGGNALTGLGGTGASIGFDGGDEVNWLLLPESFSADVLQMTSKTNLGDSSWNGNWFNEFNLVGHLAPLMPCLQTRKCCVQNGNAYFALNNCAGFDQWDYLNRDYVNTPDVLCPAGTQFNTEPTVCVCSFAGSFNCTKA